MPRHLRRWSGPGLMHLSPASYLTSHGLKVIQPMWVTLTWKDAVDLIIVTVLFYPFLLLLRRTHARFIVNAIGGLLVLYAMARFLNLYVVATNFLKHGIH